MRRAGSRYVVGHVGHAGTLCLCLKMRVWLPGVVLSGTNHDDCFYDLERSRLNHCPRFLLGECRDNRRLHDSAVQDNPQVLADLRLDVYLPFSLRPRTIVYLHSTPYHRARAAGYPVCLGRFCIRSVIDRLPPNERWSGSSVRSAAYHSDNHRSLCTREWHLWWCN